VANYWLELVELEETARKLGRYVMKHVRGRKMSDPESEVQSVIQSFFAHNPDCMKHIDRFNVECAIIQGGDDDDDYYGVITDLKVYILD
jgi:hypothetical protein